MSLAEFTRQMPKVELHVHLEASIRPETLLRLARQNNVSLPATTLEELHDWYTFRDFPHFIEIYRAISACLRTPDDIELVAREFLVEQARQNILYTELTYTALNHYVLNGIEYADQIAALNRAIRWGERELGVSVGLIIDIPRKSGSVEEGYKVAEWAVGSIDKGVVAIGLGGREPGNPPQKFQAAFDLAHAAGLPLVLHAGENAGPESMWDTLKMPGLRRIGHGVRCLEDTALVAELRERQIPLEVCISSNVALGIVPSLPEHPWSRLAAEGLYLTVNTDGAAIFKTTLSREYLLLAETFGLDAAQLEELSNNGLRASLLPAAKRAALEKRFDAEFTRLNQELTAGKDSN